MTMSKTKNFSEFFDMGLFYVCFTFWLTVYGMLIVAIEATNGFVFFCLFMIPVISYCTLRRFSIPPNPESEVAEILGEKTFIGNDKRSEDALKEIENCDGLVPLKVIAHRFAGLDAPENSLQALQLCYEKGCVAVEFDVQLTSDKVAIVFHDSCIDRLTNLVGDVSKYKWQELKDIDIAVNHPFGQRFANSTIPTFESVVDKCLEYDMRMIIDVKDSSSEMIQTICDMFDKKPQLYKRAAVSSFNPFVVYGVRQKRPGIVGAMAWRPNFMSYSVYSEVESECVPYHKNIFSHGFASLADIVTTWMFNNVYYHILGLSAVLIHKNSLSVEEVNRWQRLGKRVIAWSVNVPIEKVHFSRNLNITYMTDTMSGD